MAVAIINNNLTQVHFSVQGPEDCMFSGGIYHGIIKLPNEFPFRAPHIQLLTPNGRFDLRTDVCIDGYTAWHEESWSASKNIAAIIRAVRSIFADLSQRGNGYCHVPVEAEVMKSKFESKTWVCKECGMNHANLFLGTTAGSPEQK